jgi:hypothetical protein
MTFMERLPELKAYVYLLLLIGSLGLPADAQTFQPLTQLPDAPTPHKIFWAEVGAYTAANILDGISTAHNIRNGYLERGFPSGSSYLLGHRPSVARYVVTMGLVEAGVSFAAYRLERSRSKWLRVAGHGLMLQRIYAHTDGYVRNVGVGPLR